MASKRKFPWKSLLFVLILVAAGVFYVHETQKYGKFKGQYFDKYTMKAQVNLS